LEIQDHAEKRQARVHAGLLDELDALEARSGGVPDVRVPTLIVHGRQDTTTELAYSREWAQGRRHVRLVEVEDGHELVDSLERITAEADEFLRPFLASPAAR
jgi:pimeloyl-ACP methyl ester carboxylesterase